MAELIIIIILTIPYSGEHIVSGEITQPQKNMEVCQNAANFINMQGGGRRLQRQKLAVQVIAKCEKHNVKR